MRIIGRLSVPKITGNEELLQFYIIGNMGGARGVTITILGNRHDDQSSYPRRGCLHSALW